MDFKDATPAQQKAITEKGNILVSAAAGSGKTAVLVERVISKLIDRENPISADRLLIVTFTNAAAAEMRSRIEKRIYEECKKHPDDAALKKQKLLIASAKICTIDSFCIDLVRENFEALSVSPDFKIVTDSNLREISNKVIYDIITEKFKSDDGTFYELLELTGCEYDESNLVAAVQSIFGYSMQTPFPDLFLERLVNKYKSDFNKDNYFYKECLNRAEKSLENIKNAVTDGYKAAETLGTAGEKFTTYFECVYKSFLPVEEALNNDWDALFNALKDFSIPRLPNISKNAEDPSFNTIKKSKSVIEYERSYLLKMFVNKSSFIDLELKRLYKPISMLVDIIKQYKDELFKAQLEDNAFTFYNTEQLALEFLCEYKNGEIAIRDRAKEVLNQFDEILVDEYQDVNDLQDILFYILSNKEQKLFAVGDLKQSIYGFRGANPKNFLEKKKRYIPLEKADENSPKKIILANNFRSRAGVCDFVNFFFSNFMNSETGDIVYDSEEELIATAEFSESKLSSAKLVLIENIKASADDRVTVEADAIANNIFEIMNSGECIHEKGGGLRKPKYSDFAILLRATKGPADKIATRLSERGIPVNYPKENFLKLLEVETFLSLLKVIDNPADNISMLTVMMSPIFNFSAEQLAEIKSANKKADLISCIAAEKENNANLKEFYATLSDYRSMALIMPLSSLIHKLIDITGYGDFVLSMSDGQRRRANLLKLADFAAMYEQNTLGSISGFLEYMQKAVGEKEPSVKVSGGENAVKIMSIHASKGLQFPVCIIANLDSRTNMSDSNNSMLFSEKYGIGFRYFDEKAKEKIDTLPRILISDEMRYKTLEEELRLLYVAMTRAEDMLIFVSAYGDLQKKLGDIGAKFLYNGSKITREMFSSVSSIGDWILAAGLLHCDGQALRDLSGVDLKIENSPSKLSVEIVSAPDIMTDGGIITKSADYEVDTLLADKIRENISYQYPFDVLKDIVSKTSVSAVVGSAEGDKFAFSKNPSFMEKNGIGATGRGTALHKVMQFIDFDKADDINSEIDRLYEWEYISELEAESIDKNALRLFFKSDLFNRVKKSQNFFREKRFLTELPATQLDSTLQSELMNEKIIVQGAVDLCFIEDGEIVVVDFKTDRVDNLCQLKDTYSEQLNIYAQALNKIFDKPIKEKLIYSFQLNDFIKV